MLPGGHHLPVLHLLHDRADLAGGRHPCAREEGDSYLAGREGRDLLPGAGVLLKSHGVPANTAWNSSVGLEEGRARLLSRLGKAKGPLPKFLVRFGPSGLPPGAALAALPQGSFRPNHSCDKGMRGISLPDSFFLWLLVVRCSRTLSWLLTLPLSQAGSCCKSKPQSCVRGVQGTVRSYHPCRSARTSQRSTGKRCCKKGENKREVRDKWFSDRFVGSVLRQRSKAEVSWGLR